jgi:hypothetical protein
LVFDLKGNTTMNIRNLSLAITAIAAISPVVASASPEDVALNACAKAFAASVAAPGAAAPSFKLSYAQRHFVSPVSDFYTHNYSFTMKAQNAKTGTAFASATCSADTRGDVLELTSTATPSEAKLASR